MDELKMRASKPITVFILSSRVLSHMRFKFFKNQAFVEDSWAQTYESFDFHMKGSYPYAFAIGEYAEVLSEANP